MNTFLYTAMAFCVVSCSLPALAQYQASAYGGGYSQQRKMAPTPQTYGQSQQQQSGYGAAAAADAYEQPSYSRTAPMVQTQYEERQQPAAASSYGRQTPSAYGSKQSSGGYGQQQASSYAKPAAPKYEEPYHPPMPFAWGYDINDGYGGAQYHKENGDEYGKRTGSYGYTDAYGIYRQVDYVADEHGFRATIKTNEPGTANESPADVELHAYEPPSNYYAGNSGYSANSGSSYGSKGGSYGSSSSSSGYAAASSAPAAAYSAATPASTAPSSYSQAASSVPRAQPASYGSGQRSSGAASSQLSYAATKHAAPTMLVSPYASRPSSGSQYGGSSAASGEQTAQYSSSVIVPVYQKPNAASSLSAVPKALIAAAAPAKRHL